jgi:hypothetical protein
MGIGQAIVLPGYAIKLTDNYIKWYPLTLAIWIFANYWDINAKLIFKQTGYIGVITSRSATVFISISNKPIQLCPQLHYWTLISPFFSGVLSEKAFSFLENHSLSLSCFQ